MAAQGPKTKSGRFRSKRRKTKRKSRAKRPEMIKMTQRSLPLVSSAAATGYLAHVDKLLSQANSKLYRQGMNYHVSVNLAMPNASTSSNYYQIFTLNKDHRTIGAMKMARSIYNQAMKDELEIRPEVKSP